MARTYTETLEYLYHRLPMFQQQGAAAMAKQDLTKTEALMAQLGNPERQFRSVHVAGTNGKGSSAHMLAAIAQAAGYKVGLYTSPHLREFTERIRINGAEIPPKAVVGFVDRMEATLETLKPSFFEATVGMAFDYFAQEQVDLAIVEVGLGGRLDSTNVITPEVALITNISLDHQRFLGDTLPEIAAEKAGIMKPGVPAIVSEYQPEVMQIFGEKSFAVGCPLMVAEAQWHAERTAPGLFTLTRHGEVYLKETEVGLLGLYQRHNLPGVLAVVEQLQAQGYNLGREHVAEGLKRVVEFTGLKGRWQILGHAPLTVADTGHNQGGLRAIMEQLAETPYQKLRWVWGMVGDKPPAPVLGLLPSHADYYFCAPKIPRAMPTDQLVQAATEAGLRGRAFGSVAEALAAARADAEGGDVIMIGGSTFVVAELEEL